MQNPRTPPLRAPLLIVLGVLLFAALSAIPPSRAQVAPTPPPLPDSERGRAPVGPIPTPPGVQPPAPSPSPPGRGGLVWDEKAKQWLDPTTGRFVKGPATPTPKGEEKARRDRDTKGKPAKPPEGRAAKPEPSKGKPRSVHYGATRSVPKIQFPIESVQGNLYFDPLDAFVEPGREFEISVALNNRTGRSADGFDFTVAYDPRWLEFLSCDASILTPYVGPGSWVEMAPYAAEAEEPPVYPALAPAPGPEKGSGRRLHFTRSRGRLMFSAEFARPLTGERTRLITLKFRAAEGAGITSLRFLHPPERVAAVFSSGDNILGNNERSLRGLLNANLFIESLTRPAAAGGTTTRTMGRVVDLDTVMPSELEPEAQPLSGWSRAPSDAQLEARVAIHLQPPERVSFHVGDTFWVDLVLINDSGAPISSIGATVAFDPSVLEVIDEDKDNWILEGTNVWDGGFHETYPFDFHWANSADNERGIIAYRAGRYNRPWTFPTGVFARIHFRALASCETTSVHLERSTEGARPQTYLRSFGVDRLDKTWNPRNPPRVDLRIAPAPIASANGTAS